MNAHDATAVAEGFPPGRGYTEPMKSVADGLRERTAARVLAMPAAARIALALALGDQDAALFATAVGCDPDTARRRLGASRRHGRTPSHCAAATRP
ncbi:MAG TPA: hypothetical protein VF147_04840 [Vicinamibacterales bacterium]